MDGLSVCMIVGGLYFLPTIIANLFVINKTVLLFIVNLCFGWSFIGWLSALIWSIGEVTDARNGQNLQLNS